jgi:hypothetical protein
MPWKLRTSCQFRAWEKRETQFREDFEELIGIWTPELSEVVTLL